MNFYDRNLKYAHKNVCILLCSNYLLLNVVHGRINSMKTVL